MEDDGSVSQAGVIHVLTAIDSLSTEVSGETVTIVKDGVPDVFVLPVKVPRKMLHALSRKLGIRIEYFYNPAMVAKGNDVKH